MKSFYILISLFSFNYCRAQCTCSYTFSGAADTLSFTNLSLVSNAHYYWNFGDGSSSYDLNPIHIFPESGKYLVTLYGRDTISNCHTYYEQWITVTRNSEDVCDPFYSASIIHNDNDDYIAFFDSSINCGQYDANEDGGPAQNFGLNNWIWLGSDWNPALFVTREQFYSSDSINGFGYHREYYQTLPYNFSSNSSYDPCSPNFEFYIDYRLDGAMVYLKSMYQSGIDTFWIIGFGNPILLTGHSVSYLYPYISYERYFPWILYYSNRDTLNDCYVHFTQNIFIKNPNYHASPSCAFLTEPKNDTVQAGENSMFIVSLSDSVDKQWQQDGGTGYTNLTNAGPFSGVTSDTLIVHNAQLQMNNYRYRCIASYHTYECHNTSEEATLVVLDESDLSNLEIFPNPASEILNISGYTPFKIELFNALGQKVLEGVQSSSMNMSNLANGFYDLLFYNSQGMPVHAEKILKQ